MVQIVRCTLYIHVAFPGQSDEWTMIKRVKYKQPIGDRLLDAEPLSVLALSDESER